jgi:uncharacterized Ntn-hydrolase superfamily protein
MTFSITARCEKTGMLGVAVSTARPAVRCKTDLFPYTVNLLKRKEGSK